jgi:hypothetical protein
MFTSHSARGVTGAFLVVGFILVTGCTGPTTPADTETPPSVIVSPTNPPAETPLALNPATPAESQETPVKINRPSTLQGLSDADAALPVYPPTVLLSHEHEATCHVKVDQPFPELSLQTLQGEATRLSAHLGPRLTVVVFWDRQHPMAVEQISRLDQEVARPYTAVGVKTVAVNVGDPAEDLANLLSQIEHEFVNLRDPDRQAYAQIASDLLPRSYLLGADGEILWLDVEYSRSTRRELRNAILYHLRRQIDADQQQAEPLM